MLRRALALAVLAALLCAPGAHAAGHALTLADPRESSCSGTACTPDLYSLAIYWDDEGTIYASTTFAEPLPAASAPAATRVRINLGRGPGDAPSSCSPTGDAAALNGTAGDIRIEIGAYDGGASASSAADGVLYRVGAQAPITLLRSISADRRTITVSVTSPALAGLDLRCAQADLVADDGSGAVRDQVGRGWFPGFIPRPSIGAHVLDASATGATVTAQIDPGGAPATARIDVGTRAGDYEAQPESAGFSAPQQMTFTLRGLAPATTYHYRIAVTASDQATYSAEATFTTARRAASGTATGTGTVPTLVKRPSLTGARKAGALLTCRVGSWKRAQQLRVRWLRDGRRIAKATARTYRARPADRGRLLRCSVSARSGARTRVAKSLPVRIA